MKLSRQQVYEVVNSERAYQDALPPSRTDGAVHTVGDYVTMMQFYQNQLVTAWTMNPGDEQALNVLRKMAGIAVRAMEEYGAPRREGF